MKVGAQVTVVGLGLIGLTCMLPCVGEAGCRTRQGARASEQKSGEFFKNVTTSTLKELTPSDFLGAMGVMTAALAYDCSNCHPGAGTDQMDWVTDNNPRKKTARRMVEMVAAINREHFGGTQVVTCWTCHHGLEVPTTSIALDKLYGAPNEEKGDVIDTAEGEPPAGRILDEYIQAMGGAEKLAGLKSYIVTGHSEGYAGLGGNAAFQIFAQAPDRRGMWINSPEHPDRGISAWTYNGQTGWISTPRGFLREYPLNGNAMTQSEVPGTRDSGYRRIPGPGHFRLGRLNEAAGVCGGRGSYGY